MNKQEAIEKIEKGKSNFNAWEDLVRNRAFEDALTIVRKLDEPEKPVVPQFVADFYEPIKDGIRRAIVLAKQLEEQEKLYTVEIPNPNEWFYSFGAL